MRFTSLAVCGGEGEEVGDGRKRRAETGPRGGGGSGDGGREQRSCAAEFNCDSSSVGDPIRRRGIKQMKIGSPHSSQAALHGAAPEATRGEMVRPERKASSGVRGEEGGGVAVVVVVVVKGWRRLLLRQTDGVD